MGLKVRALKVTGGLGKDERGALEILKAKLEHKFFNGRHVIFLHFILQLSDAEIMSELLVE